MLVVVDDDVVERPSFLGRVLLVVVLCCLYFCWCLLGWSTVGHSVRFFRCARFSWGSPKAVMPVMIPKMMS